MPFKPFRPPLLKMPLPATDSSDQESERHVKRRRVSVEDNDVDSRRGKLKSKPEIAAVPRPGVTLGYRKPLVPKDNPPSPETGKVESVSCFGMESYYNVLWRKFTTKKHKTWDGDGILCVSGGYASLRDISGRDMGRIAFNSPLLPGSELSIGGKEIEVDSLLSKEEYMPSQSMSEVKKPISTAIVVSKNRENQAMQISLPPLALVRNKDACSLPRAKLEFQQLKEAAKKTLNAAAVKSLAINSSFKNPLKESTVMAQIPHGDPVPRHDPKTPGAVVMKRPATVPKGKRIVDVVLDPLLGRHLREHQREGVKFLYECVMGMRPFNGEGAILADEMGLGKTLQTISLLWTLLKQNPIYESPPVIKKALIVCPVTLINNWQKEFRKWLGNDRIGVFVADGKKTRLTDFTMGKSYSVMIIGYERLRTVQEELTKGSGIDIVVADEGHRLKTVQNKSARAIQSLNTTRRIILSGTPIQNELSEFFAMVDFVNPGILGTLKMFTREFEGPIVKSRQPEALKKDIEKGRSRSEELANLTSMFILRRTADILSKYLPPKSEYVLFCNPTPVQANIYRHALASPVFQSALGSSESALQLITILKKLCNSPSLLSSKESDEAPNSVISALLPMLPLTVLRHWSPASSGKIRVLDQLLHNLRTTTSEKIVLVSNYTSTLDLLAALLTSLSLPFLRLDGSTPAAKRQSLVDDFNRTSAVSCFAFLLSAKAGGTGLNLIGASRLVLFDVDWNPATDIQAMARIHRDGQKRHCRIYRLLLSGGLEEKIWQRQVTKIGLADSVMEKRDGVAQFSRDELRDLFRLDDVLGCQTHELLGCECGGKGSRKPGSVEDGSAIDPTAHRDCADSETESESSEIPTDFPDVATLIKASELNARLRDTRNRQNSIHSLSAEVHNRTRSLKRKNMRSLMQYSHIDTSLLAPGACAMSNGDRKSPIDIDSGDDSDSLRRGLELEIDDDVLVSLLKEEENNVGFLFSRTANFSRGTGPDKD